MLSFVNANNEGVESQFFGEMAQQAGGNYTADGLRNNGANLRLESDLNLHSGAYAIIAGCLSGGFEFADWVSSQGGDPTLGELVAYINANG